MDTSAIPAARLEALRQCSQSDGGAKLRDILRGADIIRQVTGVDSHAVLVTLGSGLREVSLDQDAWTARGWRLRARLPLSDLPGVPVPTAEGHGGEILSFTVPAAVVFRGEDGVSARGEDRVSARGEDGVSARGEGAFVGEVPVLVATGRSHLYEGLAPTQIVQLSRIAAAAGVEFALLTNAGGCLYRPGGENTSSGVCIPDTARAGATAKEDRWQLGDLMVIDDHVNLSGASPFTGPVFVDIWQIWDRELSAVLSGIAPRRGVYAMLRGPEFQTAAETRALAGLGIDMVGMSTVLEAIALHQLGVRVCGLSVTSDFSFSSAPTTHQAVLKAVRGAFPQIRCAVEALAGLWTQGYSKHCA